MFRYIPYSWVINRIWESDVRFEINKLENQYSSIASSSCPLLEFPPLVLTIGTWLVFIEYLIYDIDQLQNWWFFLLENLVLHDSPEFLKWSFDDKCFKWLEYTAQLWLGIDAQDSMSRFSAIWVYGSTSFQILGHQHQLIQSSFIDVEVILNVFICFIGQSVSIGYV